MFVPSVSEGRTFFHSMLESLKTMCVTSHGNTLCYRGLLVKKLCLFVEISIGKDSSRNLFVVALYRKKTRAVKIVLSYSSGL